MGVSLLELSGLRPVRELFILFIGEMGLSWNGFIVERCNRLWSVAAPKKIRISVDQVP